MRRVARLILISFVAVVAAVLLAAGQTMTSVVALTAATYIVKGTNSAFNQIPDSAYPAFAQTYDSAVGVKNAPQTIVLVPYPATFRPITPPGYIFSPTFDQSVAEGVKNLEGLRPVSTASDPFKPDVIWGYSQGATVVTKYKEDYNSQANPPSTPPTFVLVANPNRPNGGILERGAALGTIPILGLTFSGATPTQTAGVTNCNCPNDPAAKITTYDIARQYDGVADAPVNPLNVVADANAIMGFYYLHGAYPNIDPAAPPNNLINQGTYGDTQYYLVATYPLPLLMPLESIPVIGFPLADTLDPPLRVIVESAYDRNTSPGVPTPMNPLYFPNPVTFGTNLLVAVPTGLDNGVSDFTGSRPLGTTRPGAYGVGGPATPVPSPTPVSTPTIPVLFTSPGGGFLALLDPTTLPANLTTFTQLASSLNGGLPVTIPSLLDPMGALPGLGSGIGQRPIAANSVTPADASSTVAPTQLVAAREVPTPESTSSDPQSALKDSVNSDVLQGSVESNPAQQQPSNDNQSSDITSGPRLNVTRPPLWVAPGSHQGTSGTNGSPSTVTNPTNSVTSAVSGVTSSIKSALGGLSGASTSGGTK